jgi:carboxylesterase
MSDPTAIAAIRAYVDAQRAGVELEGAEPVFQPNGSQAFLVLHGWAATPESVRFLIKGLSNSGHAVLAPILPGHGTSAEDLTQKGPLDWISAAREALKLLADAYGPVHVLGVSMGGTLGLQLAALEAPRVLSLTTVNAAVFIERPEYAIALLIGPPEELLETWQGPLCLGPPVDEITYPKRSRKSGIDVMAMAGLARATLPRVQAPLLILQSVHDPLVAKANADTIFEKAGSLSKRVEWLHNSLHASQLDLDRDAIVQFALAFASTCSLTRR